MSKAEELKEREAIGKFFKFLFALLFGGLAGALLVYAELELFG